MSVETPQPSVRFSEHARLRYAMRGGAQRPDREAVVRESIPIGAPDVGGRVRLHPPTGMLLVIRSDVVVTVLRKYELELNDSHLTRCEACELRRDPRTDDSCPWCSGVSE